MITKVVYQSSSPAMAALAEAIARAVGSAAQPISPDLTLEHTDLLFIGDEMADGKADAATEQFIASLGSSSVKLAVVFNNCGRRGKAAGLLQGKLKAQGISVYESAYACKGKLFGFKPTKKPDEADLTNAVWFANQVMKQFKHPL